MTNGTSLASPRLAALKQELEAGNAAALEAFWQEVSQQGAPFIEPIPGNDQESLVTFQIAVRFRDVEKNQIVPFVNEMLYHSAANNIPHGGTIVEDVKNNGAIHVNKIPDTSHAKQWLRFGSNVRFRD